MNETSNPNPSSPKNDSQSSDTSNSNSQRSVFDSLSSAINEGTRQAKAAAEKAVPKIKAAVRDATYWLGYGGSFATVFSYTLVKELAPEVLKAGCRDGAQAGHRAAQDMASEWKWKAPRSADTAQSPGPDPAAPTAQPSLS